MKILLLTSMYPIPGIKIPGATSVCHYFAREWIKMGHEVHVINLYTIYPRIFHVFGRMLERQISNKYTVGLNHIRYSNTFEYQIEGVSVNLIPAFKYIPRSLFPHQSIKRITSKIIYYLDQTAFNPDVIVGHFLLPCLQIIPLLKIKYKSIPMGIVLHGRIRKNRDVQLINKYKNQIDFWGFRSLPIQQSFIDKCFNPLKSFLCPSGVPTSYVRPNEINRHKKVGVENYLYVGNLMKRKHPVAVLEGLMKSGCKFNLTYIGDGVQENNIKRIGRKLLSKIVFLGRIPRDEVSAEMRKAECFIMISEQETFGLVYLEAMASGCITIASKNEGMDGIIQDGINGFLCNAGDENELSSIIKRIDSLSIQEKLTITSNAIKTAENMTDIKCSEKYINSLSHISSKK